MHDTIYSRLFKQFKLIILVNTRIETDEITTNIVDTYRY